MKITDKKITIEESAMAFVKYSLAIVIIVMGSYGYNKFFNSPSSSEPIWLVVALFIVIELAIMSMTTARFSSSLAQTKSIGVGLWMTIALMWLVSGVGIDQTIWGMVEEKYHTVKLNETQVTADKESEKLFENKIASLKAQNNQYREEIASLQESKNKTQKYYEKTARQIKDIIWYGGKRCDLSADCTARRDVAQNALDLAKQELDSYMLSIKTLKQGIATNNETMTNATKSIDGIVAKRVAFEKNHRITLDNKKEEALVHVKLMDALNLLGLKIQTPERAYVILLSFIIYPVYILFVAFIASNSPKMQELREQMQAKKLTQNAKRQSASYLKKLIIYLISTRVRKVLIKEIEKEVEVIKEVEKIIYKDGKEIVKVEIEVPHIIEKEVIIEKIIEKPIIEKEYITIPADIDLNEFNKLAGYGTVPIDLKEMLQKINESTQKNSQNKGMSYDKYRAA